MNNPQDIRERTFEFAVRTVELCRQLEDTPGVPRPVIDALLRSGTSTGAAVDEAHSGLSKPDFIQRMTDASALARQAGYWLRLLEATGLVTDESLPPLIDESQQLTAILSTIVRRSRA